jgi:hypothetical protein
VECFFCAFLRSGAACEIGQWNIFHFLSQLPTDAIDAEGLKKRQALFLKETAMTHVRLLVKHELTFEERLVEEAKRFREAAAREPPGSTSRELLLRRARQAETASHISGCLHSPGLRSME